MPCYFSFALYYFPGKSRIVSDCVPKKEFFFVISCCLIMLHSIPEKYELLLFVSHKRMVFLAMRLLQLQQRMEDCTSSFYITTTTEEVLKINRNIPLYSLVFFVFYFNVSHYGTNTEKIYERLLAIQYMCHVHLWNAERCGWRNQPCSFNSPKKGMNYFEKRKLQLRRHEKKLSPNKNKYHQDDKALHVNTFSYRIVNPSKKGLLLCFLVTSLFQLHHHRDSRRSAKRGTSRHQNLPQCVILSKRRKCKSGQ